MLSILKFDTSVRLIAGLSVMVCAIVLLTGWVKGPIALVMKAGVITLIVTLLLLPLYNRKWFHGLYRLIRAEKYVFPVLDGEWCGEIRSNWPLVRKMLAVSRGEQPGPFDPLNEDLGQFDWGPPIEVTATIRSGFLDFKMTMCMVNTSRRSETLIVKLDRTETGAPRLRYIYRQFDEGLNIAPTDRETHLGSAELTLSDDGNTLSGRYWTDRVGEKGLNTAGRLVLRRVETPPEQD